VAPVTVSVESESVRQLERLPMGWPVVLLIGTLDTKAADVEYVAAAIERSGVSALLLDSSVGGEEAVSKRPLLSRSFVARAAGSSIEAISKLPRGEAVAAMRVGVKAVTEALVTAGRVHGAICIGGAGAHVAGPAFQALPIGFPKLIVSPLASGQRQFEPYVGLRDVAVMHSVADLAGVNQITGKVYDSAAGYIVGAAKAYESSRRVSSMPAKPTVAVSMNGNTTPALDRARARLEAQGFSVVAFHANGVGGRALEDFVASGDAAAALDYTTTELGAHVVGGLMDSGPSRMEGAGQAGIPQVLVPGCVDFITCGRWDDTESEFPERTMFAHNPELTLVRLTVDEMATLGRIFAQKANKATGPTTLVVPTRGFSVPDCEDGPFWDPQADQAFIDALTDELSSSVKCRVIDAHINDPAFADLVVEELLAVIAAASSSAQAAIGS
jgi:uncharacterized protein (UPF0261 family)